MTIELVNHNGYLQLEYSSRYASGGIPVRSPQELINAIEEVCGRGSFCLYKGKGESFPDAVNYSESKYITYPTITYWQQGVKTQVIEECREVAKKVFGDIPEMEIGWLENQCRSYIEDIKRG